MTERLAYLALRAAVGLIGLLPEPVMRRLGRLGGLVWRVVDPARRRMAERHMLRAGAADPRAAAREVFASYGRYWAESFWVRPKRLDEMRLTATSEGVEHLVEIHRRGSGMILALPHLGNWESAALVSLELDLPLVAVAERLANRRITEWFTRQRSMFGIEIVLTGGGTDARRKLGEALDGGKLVALLCDRDLGGRGVEVEFFGEKTRMPAGPLTLALKHHVPVLPVGVYLREGSGRHVHVHPPLRLETTGRMRDDVVAGTQRLADSLESIIRSDPSQWHLFQPNWPSDREQP